MDFPRTQPEMMSEDELARHEDGINRVAWTGGLTVAFVTCILLTFLLLTQAETWWQYSVYVLLAGIPLSYAAFSNFIVRQMQVMLLHRHHAQLSLKVNELQEMASKDELTGLYNRRYFYQAIQNELGKARAAKETLALLLMDLDGLKRINDEFGHGVGDIVIAGLSRAIVKHIRGSDVAARLGGDEFGIIMPSTDKRGAFSLARRLWEELEQTPVYEEDGKYVMVTVSIGVSGYPWGGEDLDEMIHWADSDMYANKVARKLPKPPAVIDPLVEAESMPEDLTPSL
ncbi:MAG: GGDEF domain-containing protein [Chloroflexi bacterium]|nr:MAG: GGDEF domain-containing protein [Chloroflexota bacterium]